MSKKLLTIFSLLLIFFVTSCNNKSTDTTPTGPTDTTPTDPAAPLKDSQYVGKWYNEKASNVSVIEIKQDGSIDWFDQAESPASASGTDVIKQGDAKFKATFSKNGETTEIVFTFTSAATGSMTFKVEQPYGYDIVKK